MPPTRTRSNRPESTPSPIREAVPGRDGVTAVRHLSTDVRQALLGELEVLLTAEQFERAASLGDGDLLAFHRSAQLRSVERS